MKIKDLSKDHKYNKFLFSIKFSKLANRILENEYNCVSLRISNIIWNVTYLNIKVQINLIKGYEN